MASAGYYTRHAYEQYRVQWYSLQELREQGESDVRQAVDNQDYCLALQKYFAGLKNMHTIPIYNSYSVEAAAKWRKDSLYVTVNKTGLSLNKKDRILSIDGMNACEWRKQMKENNMD